MELYMAAFLKFSVIKSIETLVHNTHYEPFEYPNSFECTDEKIPYRSVVEMALRCGKEKNCKGMKLNPKRLCLCPAKPYLANEDEGLFHMKINQEGLMMKMNYSLSIKQRVRQKE